MDENNNQNEMDQIERKMKNVAKDAGRKVGDVAKKLLKQAVKALIRAIGIKVIIIIVAVVLAIALLAGMWYAITDGVFDDVSESVSGNVTEITGLNDRQYYIDTEELEQRLDEFFKRSKINPETVGFSKDYTLLKKFLQAELTTCLPDLRERFYIGTPIGDDEIQGCIEFHRKKADNTTVVLEYMPYDEYSNLLATVGTYIDENQTQGQIYFEKQDVENVYYNIESVFTLDEERNVIIANMSTTEKQVVYSDHAKEEGKTDESEFTYTIVTQKINLEPIVQKYAMPFEFLVALLMTSQNTGFCESVVDLVKDSQIIIEVQENKVSKVITDKYNYVANYKLEKCLEYYYYKFKETDTIVTSLTGIPEHALRRVNDSKKNTQLKQINVTPYSTTTTTINDSQIQLGIAEVKNWIVEYNNIYTNNEESYTVNTNTWTQEDDASYTTVQDSHDLLDEVEDIDTFDLPILYYPTEGCYEKVEEKKTNKNGTTETAEMVTKYIKSSSTLMEAPEKFLSLLKYDPNTCKFDLENPKNNSKTLTYISDSKGTSESPINNLLSAKEVLYEMLESNSKTVQLRDVMEYLFNTYEGKGKTTTSIEIFEIYKNDDFINITLPGAEQDHSAIKDIQDYNLNVFNGYIEYKQTDYKNIPPAYKATETPAGTIKDKGCMPTSIAIILSGLGVKDSSGNAYTPESLISSGTIASNIAGGSSYLGNAKKTFNNCGIQISEYRSTKRENAQNDIKNSLGQGKPIFIHAGEGYYTSGGHFMTLIGINGEQVYLSNPGSRSKTGWVSLSLLIERNVDWYVVCNV